MKSIWKLSTIVIILSLLLSVAAFASPISAATGQNSNPASQRLLVQFKPGTSWSDMARVHRHLGGKLGGIIPEIGVQVVDVPAGRGFIKSQAYRLHRQVKYVELDSLVEAVDVPNDPYFDNQWGMTKVQAPQAWSITEGSADIHIAILDTGIDMEHPDLAGKIVDNINFSDSTTPDANGHNHGTHVAGIAAAATDNGIGVAGMGHNSSLMNVKVLSDDGSGYYSWVAQGIIWAADNGADVINLSLGGTSPSTTLEQAVDYAWSKGAVVVAAAGNYGSSSPFYPAYYTNCIAVGGTDSLDNLYSWSNRGDWVDVAAPGLAYSTMPDGQYGSKAGTSMASPFVAGLSALVFTIATDSNGDGELNDEVRAKIESTCDNVGVDVVYGRINACQAVQGSSAPLTGQISGVVTDAASGEAISGATVTDGTRSATTG
ncbi:MAG: peptidase S8, partial [Dehalococcoidia bacterium]|nr:peptidase S8 [Dehalococcoidia bacterium]